jgi:hypothetical protein
VFVLVVEVTKVMILSILFSLKEEQDHEREKEAAARVTFVTSVLKLNLEPPTPRTPRGLAFQHPAFRVLVAGYGSSRSHAVGGTLSGIFGKRSLVQIYILCLGTS